MKPGRMRLISISIVPAALVLSGCGRDKGLNDNEIINNGSAMVSQYGTVRINLHYFQGEIAFGQTAIAWFGKVNRSDNYADIRCGWPFTAPTATTTAAGTSWAPGPGTGTPKAGPG